MLWLYPGASGVKTGFTAGAGCCLVATARRGARELAVIVLGGRDEVFSDAAALLNHGFAAYRAQTLVAEGSISRQRPRAGGAVPVVAGERLEALVPIGGAARSSGSSPSSPSAAFPPASGSEVGTLRLTLGRRHAREGPAPRRPTCRPHTRRGGPGGAGPPVPSPVPSGDWSPACSTDRPSAAPAPTGVRSASASDGC